MSDSVFSFPHARGDGPQEIAQAKYDTAFSPRPWGWSEISISRPIFTHVFPTPVGMVRFSDYVAGDCYCFPHARGDGPKSAAWKAYLDRFPHARGDGPGECIRAILKKWFSPRPWGWFAGIVNLEKRQR